MSLSDYTLPNSELPDQFEPEPHPLIGFPCSACKHIERPAEECKGCCHY